MSDTNNDIHAAIIKVMNSLAKGLVNSICDLDAARRESFDAGFDAGFAASGEGYNFEYPFQDHCIKPREDLEWSTHASNARAIWMARFEVQEVSE